ncbi:FAD-binding oxidoreductase [Micromonospora olivasterospora]|uniref:FAD/FMN-containing dehydrogenase n=1 Tax=Micromonospora olivasterospora TaxID=1880 RepID=A0A562IFF0_MICOL|nr:FAD-binding oxidoreductase [Micromonospora olivasterospora]TWH69749.1 FAD/FMN-containing dehydrogenase [Micromonospora olivasterospora]
MTSHRSLARLLAGKLLGPVPGEWHRDFGRIRCQEPQAVVFAAGAADVQETVRYASAHGLPVVARGNGCSSNGQALTDGLLLDTAALDRMELTGAAVVRVEAGVRWGTLHRWLHEHGLALPVVTSNEHASVGGTLSVGGFGPTSPFLGAVVDQVVALDVVTGDAALVHATADGPHQDLFWYALCGLGQVGLIVRAELRVVPAQPAVLIRRLDGGDLATVAEQVWRDERLRLCRAVYSTAARRWKVEVGRSARNVAAEPDETLVADYHQRLFEAEAGFSVGIARGQVAAGLLADETEARRLWSDFFLPMEKADAFFAAVRERFADPTVVPVVNGAFLRTGDRPRPPLSPLPDADRVRTFGFYCIVPPDRVDEYREHFDAAGALCHELGGRQYLHGYHRVERDFYRAQFGVPTVDRWRRVKRRYDPGTVLGPQLPI